MIVLKGKENYMNLLKRYLIFISGLLLSACGGTADNLKEGMPAPNFSLNDQNGKRYSLEEYKGKSPVVLYFYPKAGTPGCTKQACGIRDSYKKFQDNNITIFGISVDLTKSLKEFEKDDQLNFPLLSDSTKQISEKYGVLNRLGFSSRITFIIDKNGIIANIIRDVDVDKHADQVFELAKKLLF
jgi:peroxiredoxin Q/BCP